MTRPGRLLTSQPDIADLLRGVKRVAVLGIRSESSAGAPAHYVPAYLVAAGLDVVPVPVYEPQVTTILGKPVVRQLAAIEGPVDLVDVFRRPEDIPAHLPDLLALKPRAVWFQAGIRNDEAAAQLVAAGIDVIQDLCLMVAHRQMALR